MRRLLLTALAALTLAAPARAGNGNWPSGLTKYTFQDGVSPTTGYTGCEDTFVSDDSAGVTLTIRNFGARKYLATSDQLYSGGEKAFMIKFNVLASDGVTGGIPANFVCTYARLSVYKISNNDAGATTENSRLLYCYRSLRSWTEGSGNGTAAGLANYDSTSTQGAWNTAFDAANENTPKWRTGVALDAGTINTDSTSVGAATGFFGSDTLFQSIPTVAGTVASGDHGSIPVQPTDVGRARVYGVAGVRNFGVTYFDVTHDVSLMLSGQIKNNGWIFTNSESGLVGAMWFASSEYTASKNRRPQLEIWGYTISAGGGSTGRRYMGGPR